MTLGVSPGLTFERVMMSGAEGDGEKDPRDRTGASKSHLFSLGLATGAQSIRISRVHSLKCQPQKQSDAAMLKLQAGAIEKQLSAASAILDRWLGASSKTRVAQMDAPPARCGMEPLENQPASELSPLLRKKKDPNQILGFHMQLVADESHFLCSLAAQMVRQSTNSHGIELMADQWSPFSCCPTSSTSCRAS